MAVSKIHNQNGAIVVYDSVDVLSDGTHNYKTMSIPYKAGYVPCGIIGMSARASYDGFTKIYDWSLYNMNTNDPKISVYWTSVLSSGYGVLVVIAYIKSI